MSFDISWENYIYNKELQINKYPFDQLVSLVNQNFDKKKLSKDNFKAIELGCGTGNNLNFLIDFGFDEVVGLDGSETAINIARQFVKNIKCTLLVQDFTKIPYQDSTFDLCVDRGSVTHNDIRSLEKIFYEVYRVLKSNGIFISFLFSKDHYAFNQSINEKNTTIAFKNEIKSKKGLITSFFDHTDIQRHFSKFKIINLIHDIKEDFINNDHDKNAMWIIVAKK